MFCELNMSNSVIPAVTHKYIDYCLDTGCVNTL